MKRKLISHEAFESMKNSSVSNAKHELTEAKSLLEKALQVENLSISHFNQDSVVYESNGSYIYANYKMDKNKVVYENIEQLVIDKDSEDVASKKLVASLVDALLDENEAVATEKANNIFEKYINSGFFKRTISESCVVKGKKDKKKDKKEDKDDKKKKLTSKKLKLVLSGKKVEGDDEEDAPKKDKKGFLKFKKVSEKAKKLKEWASLVENVEGYLDYKTFGPVLKESVVERDAKGNIISLTVPSTSARNEAKLLSFNWKTLDTDVKVLRSGAKKLAENVEFCKAIASIKRFNAISDNAKIQECLEDLVSRFSNVLYLTQNELSNIVSEALQSVNASNFDDQTCDFIAEAILVTAHESYSERVAKIMTLAGASLDESADDAYQAFKDTVDVFYNKLDESTAQEMQVFVDLYESLRSVYSLALNSGNDFVKQETAAHLNGLLAILEEGAEPSLDVAYEAAEWLANLIETNLDSEVWNVSNNVHISVNGEHPKMSMNAKKSYAPSSDFSGKWSSTTPVSDGSGDKAELSDELEKNGWSNIGGEDSWPSLSNPYVPKPFGDYKIKGEKAVDDDSDQLAHVGGEDTWPNLSNPYLLKAADIKMNNGAGTDLVDKE